MVRLIWSQEMEKFPEGSGFLERKSKISEQNLSFHLPISTSSRPLVWIRTTEMSVEMDHAHPTEFSIRGFDASHLLQLSANHYTVF